MNPNDKMAWVRSRTSRTITHHPAPRSGRAHDRADSGPRNHRTAPGGRSTGATGHAGCRPRRTPSPRCDPCSARCRTRHHDEPSWPSGTRGSRARGWTGQAPGPAECVGSGYGRRATPDGRSPGSSRQAGRTGWTGAGRARPGKRKMGRRASWGFLRVGWRVTDVTAFPIFPRVTRTRVYEGNNVNAVTSVTVYPVRIQYRQIRTHQPAAGPPLHIGHLSGHAHASHWVSARSSVP